MKFHKLEVSKKSTSKRKGRGIASGKGKTAGRGTKGQHARTGFSRKPGFEGGQTPLNQRIPKLKGFKSIRQPAQVVYTDVLNLFEGKIVDNLSLAREGYVASPYHAIKIIMRGKLTKALDIRVQSASKSSLEMIVKAGGSFEFTDVPRLNQKSVEKSKPNAD